MLAYIKLVKAVSLLVVSCFRVWKPCKLLKKIANFLESLKA
jgi:hypothetical protein